MSAKRGPKSKADGSTIDEKLSSIIENISDVLVEVDSDMKFSYVSPQIKSMFGFEPEEIIGKDVIENVHPKDLEDMMDQIGKALEGRSVIRFRFRSRHKDGHYVHVLSSGRMVEDGDDYKMIGVISDYSKQAKLEDGLKKSEALWRSITETTPDIVIVIDKDGIIRFIDRVPIAEIPDNSKLFAALAALSK